MSYKCYDHSLHSGLAKCKQHPVAIFLHPVVLFVARLTYTYEKRKYSVFVCVRYTELTCIPNLEQKHGH